MYTANWFESLVIILTILAAIFSYRSSKNNIYKTPLLIAFSAFIVILLSDATPVIGTLLIKKTSVNSMESLEEYMFFLEQLSSFTMLLGYLLLTISMYKFGKNQ